MIQRAWLSKRAVIVMAFFLAAALAFGLRMPVRAARAFAITTDGNCFVTRGTDCRPEDAVEYAEPGETLHVHFVYEGCPEGMCPYYVLVNGEEVRGNFLNSGLSFTMPAQDVTIETVYVKQFTATWDLTGGEEVFEPNDPRVTLSDFEKQNMGTDMFEEFGTAKMRGIIDFQNADPGTGEKVLCFDLDRDGTWDADMSHDRLLPGTNLTGDIYTIQMPAGCKMGTVIFILRRPATVLKEVSVTLERPDETYTAVDGIVGAIVTPDPGSHVTVSDAVWYNGDGIDGGIGLATPFIKPGRQYFAEFMLTADEGYCFAEDTVVYITNAVMEGHVFWPSDPSKFLVSTSNVVTVETAVSYPGSAPAQTGEPAPPAETTAEAPATEAPVPETQTDAPPQTEAPAAESTPVIAPTEGPPTEVAAYTEEEAETNVEETEEAASGLRRWFSENRRGILTIGGGVLGGAALLEVIVYILRKRRR